MACDSLIWKVIIFGCSIQILQAMSEETTVEYMNKEEQDALKEEARDMFYHAYNAYMDNAYPADELMPLSCKGRYRGSEPNRGDIDNTLGNFSLTLVDTLDTLVVLGDLEEFENAVKLVVKDVNFDTDVIVSLFETNIRMLGGLLSGHILAEYLQQRADIMPWYRGELLNLAKDLGYRFLPAFNTTTGIPYGRINLKHGMKGIPVEMSRETCTACAGSMILEMAALSRLTGESIFEEKAQKAMDVLWKMRHRGTDLMGSVLNVNSGDWVRRDSGVGAGIDSYYEYCLKAYILLGDEKYLGRFNKHYQAIMKYVSQGPMLLDVHMHRPNTNSKNFMDALLAFWPGLQVLKGDIKPAVETHEMLYQVMQRHNFIPEAFTTDFQVHWGHHPLRPEFLESTYFLYRATGDHYYLGVGRKVLRSLQTYARVPCGYAAVSDVRTNKHDDTMDSFVLSETFKYLYLLFAEPSDLILDLDEFIFTTEGHLLPLTLASVRTNISSQHDLERDVIHVDELDRTCPNSLHLFPATVRQPLRNMVEDVCPKRSIKRRLNAAHFQANNLEHLKILSDMGITILTLADGRVQLLHTFSNAKSPQDSEEGLLFMQEMTELIRMQSQQSETKPQAVTFEKPGSQPPEKVILLAGPARFGPEISGFNRISGEVVFTYPSTACSDLLNANSIAGKIAVMDRGNCMFIEKARRIQKAGAIAGIVLDNVPGSSAATSPMFAMSGDGKEVDDVMIPVVFLFSTEASELIKAINTAKGELSVLIRDYLFKDDIQLKAPTDMSMFERLKGSLKSFLNQQISQNSVRSSTDSSKPLEAKDEDEDKQTNFNQEINYDHLRAEIVKDWIGGEIRITMNRQVQVNSEKEYLPENEWEQLKQIFVNQIKSSTDRQMSWPIRAYIISSYYDWVLKSRGFDDVNKLKEVHLIEKVLWFLKELSDISPIQFTSKLQNQISPINKQKLLIHYLLTKVDNMVLQWPTLNSKLKQIKSGKSEIQHNLKLSDVGFKIHGHFFHRQTLQETLLETNDDNANENAHHIAYFERIYTLFTVYKLLSHSQENFEKLEDNGTFHYNILIDNLQEIIQNLPIEDRLSTKIKDELTNEIFLIKNSENQLNNKENHISVDKEDENNDNFEKFLLKEIEKVVKNYDRKKIPTLDNIDDLLKNSENEFIKEHIEESTKDILNKSELLENKLLNLKNKSEINTQENIENVKNQNKKLDTDASNSKFEKLVQTIRDLEEEMKNIKLQFNNEKSDSFSNLKNKYKILGKNTQNINEKILDKKIYDEINNEFEKIALLHKILGETISVTKILKREKYIVENIEKWNMISQFVNDMKKKVKNLKSLIGNDKFNSIKISNKKSEIIDQRQSSERNKNERNTEGIIEKLNNILTSAEMFQNAKKMILEEANDIHKNQNKEIISEQNIDAELEMLLEIENLEHNRNNLDKNEVTDDKTSKNKHIDDEL